MKEVLDKKIITKTSHQKEKSYFETLGKISSNILHDIINPITGLILYLDMLDLQDNNYLKELITPLKESGQTIKKFIKYTNEYLNNPNENQIINIEKTIENTFSLFKPKALKNEVSLVFLKNTSRKLIIGNPLKFFQVMINLISNSIDAFQNIQDSRKRQIVVSTNFENNQMVVTIHDNGVGISAPNRQNIFRKFFSSKRDGTGVGLFSVKNIIEQDFESQISIYSQENKETRFDIIIDSKRTLHHQESESEYR